MKLTQDTLASGPMLLLPLLKKILLGNYKSHFITFSGFRVEAPVPVVAVTFTSPYLLPLLFTAFITTLCAFYYGLILSYKKQTRVIVGKNTFQSLLNL